MILSNAKSGSKLTGQRILVYELMKQAVVFDATI